MGTGILDILYFVSSLSDSFEHTYLTNYSPGPTGASPLVNITECSVSRVSFTLIQQINLQSNYTFFAACSRENGTCVSVNTN